MFSDLLLFIGLLFSLYGVSCAITSFIIWLTNHEKEEQTVLIVPLYSEDMGKQKVFSVMDKLKNSGVNCIEILVVDCGLNKEKHEVMAAYCEKKNIVFCNKEELPSYLLKSTFQIDENRV